MIHAHEAVDYFLQALEFIFAANAFLSYLLQNLPQDLAISSRNSSETSFNVKVTIPFITYNFLLP